MEIQAESDSVISNSAPALSDAKPCRTHAQRPATSQTEYKAECSNGGVANMVQCVFFFFFQLTSEFAVLPHSKEVVSVFNGRSGVPCLTILLYVSSPCIQQISFPMTLFHTFGNHELTIPFFPPSNGRAHQLYVSRNSCQCTSFQTPATSPCHWHLAGGCLCCRQDSRVQGGRIQMVLGHIAEHILEERLALAAICCVLDCRVQNHLCQANLAHCQER